MKKFDFHMFIHQNLKKYFNHADYIFNTSNQVKLKHMEDKHLQIYHSNTSNNITTSHLHIAHNISTTKMIHHIHHKRAGVFIK